MKYPMTIAAAAAGLLLATGSASATPLAPTSAPLAIEHFDGAIEPVHYRRRAVRRFHRPYYRSGPVISFGLSPYAYASPYYARPYGYRYPYRYGYSRYPYRYGYGPTFSFGFGIH